MVVRIRQFPLLSSLPAFDVQREFAGVFGDVSDADLVYRSSQRPPIDLAEHENESVVVMELPGVKKEDLTVSIQDGIITIRGERKSSGLPERERVVWSERNDGKFLRTIRLPHEVNLEQVSAELIEGILRIELPKAEAALPRKIEVK